MHCQCWCCHRCLVPLLTRNGTDRCCRSCAVIDLTEGDDQVVTDVGSDAGRIDVAARDVERDAAEVEDTPPEEEVRTEPESTYARDTGRTSKRRRWKAGVLKRVEKSVA
eukprot:2099878-Amphidinium_carterae.1